MNNADEDCNDAAAPTPAATAAASNAPRIVGAELNTTHQDDNQEEKKEKKEEADEDSDEDELPIKFASPLSAQLSEWTSLISSPIDVQCRNFILAFASDFVDTNVFEFLMDAAARFATYQEVRLGFGPLNPRHRPYQLNLDLFRQFVYDQDSVYSTRGVDHLSSSVIAHERDVANGRSRTDPISQMPLDTWSIYRISFTEYLLFTLRKTLEEYMTARNELKQQTAESSDVVERMKAKLAAYDEGVRSYNPPHPPIIDICINIEQPRPSASRRFRTFINRTCAIQICITLILLIMMTGDASQEAN